MANDIARTSEDKGSVPDQRATRSPRLWPAIVVLMIQACFLAICFTPSIDSFTRFACLMLGPLICGILFAIWLVFGARLGWRHGMLALLFATGTTAAERPAQSQWAEAMAAARVTYLTLPEAQAAAAHEALFKPYDSGPLDGQGPAAQIVVDVTGLQELRLVTKCEKHPANCNIWGEPKLIAKDGSVTRLTTLKPTSIQVGWGQLCVDKNWQDHPLQVGDRTFEFGLWVHADSELCFALDGRYERFEAQVGEDVDRAAGVVRFKVLAAAPPTPSVWMDVASKFPTPAGWLRGRGQRRHRVLV